MKPRGLGWFVAGTVVTLGAPSGVHGQIRASERGLVSQTVDGTTITVDYARPKVRGRDTLFGGEVFWGKVWTPGANWATTLETNNDITINGHTVPRGKYSVWMEVQPGAWTAIIDPEARRFHLMPPQPADNQVRFTVQPQAGPHVEVLTWSFPHVRPTGTTLRLAWATTTVDLDIAVQPSRSVTVAKELADRYVGSYRLSLRPPLGPKDVAFDVRFNDDKLVARWEDAPHPRLAEIWLVHLGEGMFVPGQFEHDALFDLVMDLVFEFNPLEGQATTFELRALGDELWGTATRMR